MSWTSFISTRRPGTAGAAAVLALALTAAPAVAQVEGKFERTLKVSGTVDLSVSSGSGSIRVQPGDIRHRASGRNDPRQPVAELAQSQRRRGARQAHRGRSAGRPGRLPHQHRQDGDDDLYDNISISYEVYVPRPRCCPPTPAPAASMSAPSADR